MKFKPTPSQEQAIFAEGTTLVSAAAGSGKTAVLVERVIRKLTDPIHPVSPDRLLIVTFTNAAAQEMRTRIEERFEEECKAHPHDASLARQKQMLAAASICTIDSFCIDLVRENFQKVGVSPDFSVSDGSALSAVNEAVLDRILSRYYEEKDPAFYTLLDLMNTEYDDRNFKNTLFNLYFFSRHLPDPDDWFDSLAEPYQTTFSQSSFIRASFSYARSDAKEALDLLETAKEWVRGDVTLHERFCVDFTLMEEKCAALYDAAEREEWDAVYAGITEIIAAPLSDGKGLNSPYAESIEAAWQMIKDIAERLAKIFFEKREEAEEQIRFLAPPLALVRDIIRELETELFDAYRERNTLTFDNTEHLALKLLREGTTEFSDRYDEIMVDEYQDTNDLQDMLFLMLSGGERLFVVGDVKQSIYGFRGANPNNFLFKSRNAVSYGRRKEGEMQKVILAENFRSKPAICEAINYIFTLLMTGENGGLVYGEGERLSPVAEYPDSPLSPFDYDLIEINAKTEESLFAEGIHIAKRIKEILSAGPCIRADKETLREAQYSDFAILHRSAGSKAPILAAALRQEGIPVNLRTDVYASSLEIETFLALLKVIDNPDSDIELLTALSSPIFGFSAEELAGLRTGMRKGSIYSMIVFAAENGDLHCKDFLQKMSRYRRMALVLPLSTLIARLLYLTDYLNIVSAMEEGDRRRNNLLHLTDLAKTYTTEYDGGIPGFIRFVANQADAGLRGAAVAGNAVRIMTIHAAKGLQFPVCILAGVSAAFNQLDLRGRVVYSEKTGLGIRYQDEERRELRTTPAREAICEEIRRRELEEEQRLLYVALTRAQDKLIVTHTVKNLEKAVDPILQQLTLFGGRGYLACRYGNSYGRWLLTAILLHPDGALLRENGENIIPLDDGSHINVTVSEGSLQQPEAIIEEISEEEADMSLLEPIRENMAYLYPYHALLDMEAKASVTAIANQAERAKYAFSDLPAFMSAGGITATERGTAMHKVMQFFDFEKADMIEEEISRLYEWQFISEREAESVDRKALKAFFASSVFGRIKAARLVKREMRFLTEIPASAIDPSLPEQAGKEGIMVQGAVDLCFEEEDGIVILDFKTDRVSDPQTLKDSYKEQLAIYALACEKIFARPVKQTVLYSFALGREIEV